ncbi:hypothetical protein [Microbulbifer sp.]|uniref:hypothetical protein n=1 Tax=Microbulbifer sp. TaxID=1908541 RepID=UPI00258F8DE1|nr:hypothetical protein [Microbulbifer sp.]
MNSKVKSWAISGVVALTTLVVNFLIFVYSYNSLTASLLTEDQRIHNANFIMSTTLPLFVASSALGWVALGFLLRKKRNT